MSKVAQTQLKLRNQDLLYATNIDKRTLHNLLEKKTPKVRLSFIGSLVALRVFPLSLDEKNNPNS